MISKKVGLSASGLKRAFAGSFCMGFGVLSERRHTKRKDSRFYLSEKEEKHKKKRKHADKHEKKERITCLK